MAWLVDWMTSSFLFDWLIDWLIDWWTDGQYWSPWWHGLRTCVKKMLKKLKEDSLCFRNTETTTREESRERRRRSWCLLPLLFLLLLLPFLGGLWWFAPVAMREKATAAHSVIHNFYHDLSSRSFGLAHDSKESLPIAPGLIFTNITVKFIIVFSIYS